MAKKMSENKKSFAVIPAPGHYGHGRVAVVSRHNTLSAARKAAASYKHLKAVVTADGLTVERGWFWSDMAPTESDAK